MHSHPIILKYLTLVLLSTGLFGQSIPLHIEVHGVTDSLIIEKNSVDSLLNRMIGSYQEQGYWDAKIELNTTGANSQVLTAVINTGSLAAVKHLHFLDIDEREKWVLKQEFTLGALEVDADKLTQAETHLIGLGYRFKGQREIARDNANNYHLTYRLQDRPELNIDALAAFNQSSKSDTVAWYGHLYLHVPNLDGRGKSMKLNWKRLKTDSEQFLIKYEHPWLLGIPLKAILSFGREVVNGDYQVIQSRAGLDWRLDWERSLIFHYENLHSLITKDGGLLNPEWRSVKRQMMGLGYRHEKLDIVAHKGFALRTSLEQELNFEPSSISRLLLRSEVETSFFPRLFLSQRTALQLQNITSSLTDPSILGPLGGVNSVRGYEENFLRSPSIMSLQHDLHLLLGSQSQLVILLDLGIYYDSKVVRHITGYGVGVQLSTGRGPLKLILAGHEGL
ncbi:MAG: BamA/TamA family outer membrane protein, partial [Candidatus Marinimicrobia bacterium]|nr:BamA/TamA family outer membrane protein [Candidatus Neomarinimicrobiota bacterium]